MRPQICIDARMMFFSGIGIYLEHLIPRLEKKFEITLLIQDRDRDRTKEVFSGSLQTMNAAIYTVKEQILYPFRIPSCDLFWAPHYNVPFFPIAARKRVTTVHDVCHLAMKEGFSKFKRLPSFLLLKKAVTKSDLVITGSEFSRREIATYLSADPEKIRVVPNAAAERKVTGVCNLSRFGITSPFILYVGNGKRHKNVERLCKAFSSLPSGYQLVWVNPESDFSACALYPHIRKLSNIANEDLAYLYTKAELLVHPSLYEGFGLTPLEAMRYGCPALVSNAASLPEVCGKAAYYVDPYDERSIYRGMKEVLENKELRKTLIEAGYQREKEFSWDKTAGSLEELFMKEVAK